MALSTSTSTLAVGASRTFGLSPGSALTLTTLPNCRVTVTETPNTVDASGVGGNSSRTHNLQLAQTVTYGPYPMGGTVVVANASNSGGAVTWVRSDAIVAESASGVVSLVSGDGTPIEGGGGGSTTFAGLTDKASADIPAINTPLANALAGKAASSHTHSIANVTSLQASLDAKAPLASPALTGTPTAPTAAGGTNTTQIATTAFVLANGGTALGPYADAAALETAKPAASNGGRIGLVGASAPYTPYVSNGTAWILFDNLVDPLVTIAASGTSVSQAAANLSVMDITLTGNATIAFTGIPAGAWCVTLLLKQDGTGSRLVTWPANTKWQGGVAPVLSTAAGSEDDVTLMTTDGGTTWRGFFNGKGMV